MIQSGVSSPGDIREEELFKALVSRFGKNCVYRSPKVLVHGQEKELGDVVVLALPYMIVFQSKWKKLTGDDLRGDRREVYRSRLIRTMHEAAGQFSELASSLRQKMTIELPQVWFPGNDATYQFPLERIEHVVPVVVVDFADAQYDNPDERFEDIPPVITDVPSQIKSWGMVHSFLLKNFYRILEQLFTVGDLLYWLQEREKMIGTNTRSIIGYSELTLFSIYLENNGLWGDLLKADCVTLTDNDGLARRIKERKKAFGERQKIFGQRNLLDAIDDTIVRFLAQTDIKHRNDIILSYLDCQGRLLCCSAKTKRETALRLKKNIVGFEGKGDSFQGSFVFATEAMPLSNTAFYCGVAPYTKEDANRYFVKAYGRTLAVLRDAGLVNAVDEVLVLFVRHPTHEVFFVLKKIEEDDYDLAPQEKIVDGVALSRAKQMACRSEWDIVRGSPP